MQFRLLRAEEIDCRIGAISKKGKGLSLLLYKDARSDMNILDETVGAENWQRKHYECKGNLFCSVGIKGGDGWIFKDDCGTESFTEKEKGESSDSFKRACVNWGIGRELYTAPYIWIDAKNCEIKENDNKKFICHDKFSVRAIAYKDRQIEQLEIYNDSKRCTCFTMGYPKTKNSPTDNMITQGQINIINEVAGDRLPDMLGYYRKMTVEELTFDEAAKAIKTLRKSKS